MLPVGVGNALAFYDFMVFAFFAVPIARAFFPSSRTSSDLLISLVVFGLGFITRPIGAIVIGYYGDRVGRTPAMVLSFALMGIGGRRPRDYAVICTHRIWRADSAPPVQSAAGLCHWRRSRTFDCIPN